MRKRLTAFVSVICFIIISYCPVYAAEVPKVDTPDYKVAFYASDCYHMQNENGKRYGYGYDMMQEISKYIQCTFSYIGYDKSPKECEEMLHNGQIDIYTAAKKTPERENDFVFSTHPAITATTCMNVKRGNRKIVSGDYSTYDGIKVGLLERHTYNDQFIEFAKEKGFECDIVYYVTPAALSKALIDGEVDALVDSYIRTPEDETTIELFGETPYYFMARKEDKILIREIDKAIDEMNMNTPKWRSDLYNKYYGTQSVNTELTQEEKFFLKQLQMNNTTIKAVMNPDNKPFSWYEDGIGYGIIADIFAATAEELGLSYEIVPVSSKTEYEEIISSQTTDIWLDAEGYYEEKYKITEPYLSTTVSILRKRSASGKMKKIGVIERNIDMEEIISSTWSQAEVVYLENTKQCIEVLNDGQIDGVLMFSYSAQQIARDDTQNRFRVDIVSGANLKLRMGINSKCNHNFFGVWQKTLTKVCASKNEEFIQEFLDKSSMPTLAAFLFDHPIYLVCVVGLILFTLFVVFLWRQTSKSKDKQLIISRQLSDALLEVRKINAHLEEHYQLLETVSRETADVFMVDVKNMTTTSVKVCGIILPEEKRISRPYGQTWVNYIKNHVEQKDRERVMQAIQIDNVIHELEKVEEYSCRYCLVEGEKKTYCQAKFGYLGGKKSDYIVVGIRCIDDIIRAEKEQQSILEEAKRMAEAANKAKSAFLFNMSHDIRTPMNAIVGYTELILKNYTDSEKCLDYTKKIQSSSEFLLSLINNVLEMARVESDRMILDEIPVRTGQIAEEVYAVYSELMNQKNIEFSKTMDVKTKYVFLDKVKVKEIFLNLVSNAYKYTPDGGKITLAVNELPCEKEGYIVLQITISDTGIGMSKEYLPKLFDEFTREHTSIESKVQGTGLGMAIVKKMIELMEGTIAVETELGRGTTFVVKLPVRKAEIEETQSNDAVVVDTNCFTGKRILLAEDNDLNAEIATEILQEVGFVVERAADGIICVDMLQKAEAKYYDIILMDIQMPNMDGYKATRTIRAINEPGKSDIIIIAMTANAFDEDRKDAIAAGMNGHIGKPIKINKLMEMLENVLT